MYANREKSSSVYDVKKMPVLLVIITMFILCLPPYFFSPVVPAIINFVNIMNLLLLSSKKRNDAKQRLLKVVQMSHVMLKTLR